MNLVADRWIPVLFHDGAQSKLSLSELYEQAEDIRDLVVNPPQRIALIRLLICITQAALDGPSDERDWFCCRGSISSGSVKYLQKWEDRFNLYGPNAFLQVPGIEPIDNAILDKLDFGLAAGNNAKLFDQAATPTGRPWPDDWRALMLLTYQCCSPCGLIGVTNWAGQKTSKSSKNAPAIERSMLHTIIRGQCLEETLHANLLTRKMIKSLPNGEWGTPVWENPPTSPNGPETEIMTRSYLGRLVPLSRAILLGNDTLTFSLANGLDYPPLPATREPSATVLKRKQGKDYVDAYLSVDPSRHPWRELASILTLSSRDVAGGPLALKHLDILGWDTADIWTGGIAADKNKILDIVEWVFSIPLELLNDSELHQYQTGVKSALDAESVLRRCIAKYCAEQKMENTPFRKARTHLWSILDSNYQRLIETVTTLSASLSDTWYPIVRDAMEASYECACPHQTPRQIQAFAIGRQRLRLKKPEE